MKTGMQDGADAPTRTLTHPSLLLTQHSLAVEDLRPLSADAVAAGLPRERDRVGAGRVARDVDGDAARARRRMRSARAATEEERARRELPARHRHRRRAGVG